MFLKGDVRFAAEDGIELSTWPFVPDVRVR
jgi:hypothetical protein